ncbi:MAG: tripartite tricarboxylate transporter TctB family protein [Nocardioidaceae bacterium]
MRLLPELVALAGCVVLYTKTLDLQGTGEGPGPAMYPRILIVLLAVAMVGRIAAQLWAIRRAAVTGSAPPADPVEDDELPVSLIRVGQVIALSVGFIVATIYLGWVLATAAFVPLFCWACGKRNLLITVPLGAVLSLGSAYVFVRLVYIALPTGVGAFDELTVRLFIALGIY